MRRLPTLVVLLASAAFAQWPELSRPPVQGGGEKDAAVIVGIETYAAVPGVPGAVQNAKDWHTWFTSARRTPVGSVKLLRNNEGTLEGMREAVAAVSGAVEPGGRLWFVFIGHGAPAQDGRDGVWGGWERLIRLSLVGAHSVSVTSTPSCRGCSAEGSTKSQRRSAR